MTQTQIINGYKVEMNQNGVFVYTPAGRIRIDVYHDGVAIKADEYQATLQITTQSSYRAIAKVVR